jgi:hypothetical protein
MNTRDFLTVAGLAGAAVLLVQPEAGAAPGDCTPSTGPDVIVGSLIGIHKFGTVGEITGYAIGTESCNIGSVPLQCDRDSSWHPVIGQNLYRLKDGRFEQIGMSWLKHGFAALTLNLCCTCQNPGTSQLLGVGCSDPYGATLNGNQEGFPCGGGVICGGLGPRSEVDATTGQFLFPYGSAGQGGDAVYKRLQVHNDDVDPAMNPGALYYGEGHYVSRDDAEAGNHHNNASYRPVLVGSFSDGGWDLGLAGSTTREQPAVYAWRDNDPLVEIREVDDENQGRFCVGYRVTDNGDGTWHYEYAIHNLNSHRSAREFIVPIGANVNVTGIGFHDVGYHSGEPFDGTDWAGTVNGGEVSWATSTHDADPEANALRWGTLYNCRFDADTPPTAVTATIGLFRPGVNMALSLEALGPSDGDIEPCPWDCGDENGDVGITDLLKLLAGWGGPGACDIDGGGAVDVTDLLAMLGHWGPCP